MQRKTQGEWTYFCLLDPHMRLPVGKRGEDKEEGGDNENKRTTLGGKVAAGHKLATTLRAGEVWEGEKTICTNESLPCIREAVFLVLSGKREHQSTVYFPSKESCR